MRGAPPWGLSHRARGDSARGGRGLPLDPAPRHGTGERFHTPAMRPLPLLRVRSLSRRWVGFPPAPFVTGQGPRSRMPPELPGGGRAAVRASAGGFDLPRGVHADCPGVAGLHGNWRTSPCGSVTFGVGERSPWPPASVNFTRVGEDGLSTIWRTLARRRGRRRSLLCKLVRTRCGPRALAGSVPPTRQLFERHRAETTAPCARSIFGEGRRRVD